MNATLVNDPGPSVTRYELGTPGVKVNKIQNLAEDIALKLAVSSVRIEPIPGKAAIGIEVPSGPSSPFLPIHCGLPEVKNAKGKLAIGLSKDIRPCGGGRPDQDASPPADCLSSNASGKSVCINTIICSLLYRAAPRRGEADPGDPQGGGN